MGVQQVVAALLVARGGVVARARSAATVAAEHGSGRGGLAGARAGLLGRPAGAHDGRTSGGHGELRALGDQHPRDGAQHGCDPELRRLGGVRDLLGEVTDRGTPGVAGLLLRHVCPFWELSSRWFQVSQDEIRLRDGNAPFLWTELALWNLR